jgi:CTP:molybdopterin cytidylyltransferase MocA
VVTGVVLAAGAGSRLGQPKAEVVLGGRRLLDRAVATLLAGGCDDVLAITRPDGVPAKFARTVPNPEPDRGMGSSLRLALTELTHKTDAVVILLVDLPGVQAAEVATVLTAYRQGHDLVAVRRAGQRSHPVLVGRRWWPELSESAEGDQGGRSFFAAREAHTHFVDLADSIADIDTAQDLRLAVSQYSDADGQP